MYDAIMHKHEPTHYPTYMRRTMVQPIYHIFMHVIIYTASFHAECWEVRLLCDNVWLQHFWSPPLNCLIWASSMTKPTIRLVRPAKPQISLRICRVWSEYLLIACAFYSLKAVQRGKQEPLPYWVDVQADLILFVLRFYSPVNPMGSCRARSVCLTTRLLGRLSPLSS